MPNIIETTKAAYEIAKRVTNIELQEKLLELREEALELQEENIRLKKEISELKNILEVKATVKFEKGVYYKEGDQVPFCPHCFEASNKLLHLKINNVSPSALLAYCCNCYIEYYSHNGGDFMFNSRDK